MLVDLAIEKFLDTTVNGCSHYVLLLGAHAACVRACDRVVRQ